MAKLDTTPAGADAQLGTRAVPAGDDPRNAPGGTRRKDFLLRNRITGLLILVFIVLCIASPPFRTFGNFQNLLSQDAVLAIVAAGMLCIMLTGGFDLSVGAAGAMASVIAATVSLHVGVGLGLLAGLGAGLGVGLINGLCIAFLNVNPLITTLGSMTGFYGLLNLVTGGSPVSGTPNAWTDFGLGNSGPIPNVVFVAGAVVLLVFLLLRFTVAGGHIYAVGSNMAAVGRVGISTRGVLCAVYIIGGVCGGIAGLLTLSQTGVGDPATGQVWALTAISAIVIGGTRLSGGVGSIKSVFVGTLLLTIMTTAFTLFGISPFWVPIATGAILVFAVAVDARNRHGQRVKSRQL